MLLIPFLAMAVAASALLAVAGEYGGKRRLVYAAKPLTTALILAMAALAPGAVSPLYRWAVVLGLALSLAGDVFLLLPRDRFVAGLASFFAAHLCYVAAFGSQLAGVPPAWTVLPFALYAALLLRILWPHLPPGLRVPVTAYAAVLSAMAWAALGQWLRHGDARSALAFAGAALFVASDSLLAADRFARPFPAARALVLGTYWAAQLLIAASVARG
ncbi:MAG TPA: lysoplasmalogenase [Longimicrobiaceae bacterium]|nr:lysoplasmalogenase [Longimicrobiaceae bacterium]